MARIASAIKSRLPDTIRLAGTHAGNHPWKIQLVEHPGRKESSFFRAAKATVKKILEETSDEDLPYGPRPTGSEHWEMHHGGSLWVKGRDGWRMYRAKAGIEWSMQFCADPEKVDRLRLLAAELVDAFPLTLPALDALGYEEARELLRRPITDADGVEAWTDSLFNSCVPLNRGDHQGILPRSPGEHHYPWPVKGADYFRYSDFKLWVTLPDGTHGAVAPVGRRGSGDGRVRLLHAPEDSKAASTLAQAQELREIAVLPSDSPVALEAFEMQIARADGTQPNGTQPNGTQHDGGPRRGGRRHA
ncbi:hypothetical protein GCM10023086_30900 [Streptomyces venetus]|uniref:DUF317 domain-containing protein n=1 Tax=Streptomyces venetus TaxID=1701086 RepID=A0ABP8FUE1_9ACTN